mmetsp:Transcript_18846/g.41069  ORF Transcript_18846/g.41069 Transcript_18846/m.41069 type:complete len:346 (+) Transcript_18846:33-1070(+)
MRAEALGMVFTRKMSSHHTKNTRQSSGRTLLEEEAAIRIETTVENTLSSSSRPSSFSSSSLSSSSTMLSSESNRPMSLPAMPNTGTTSIEQQHLPMLSIPSFQHREMSLDDSSSSTETRPCRNRSHAVNLMGVDLSSMRCNDDVTTGRHFLRVGATEIEHPAQHRRVSSSSRVAFAVEACYAEQEEAALSEKAADYDEEDDDIFFEIPANLESQAPEKYDHDDQFSFWEDYSCSCCDRRVCDRAGLGPHDCQNGNDDEELNDEGEEQGNDDDDDDDANNRHDHDQSPEGGGMMAADEIDPALARLSLTETPRTPRISSNPRKTELEQSPVSIASLRLHTNANSAA